MCILQVIRVSSNKTMRNLREAGTGLALGYALLMLCMQRVKGDAVEVIELTSNWSISNRNGCK